MKIYVVTLILLTLISLSGAVSEIKLEQQVGYNFGDLKLNQVDRSIRLCNHGKYQGQLVSCLQP